MALALVCFGHFGRLGGGWGGGVGGLRDLSGERGVQKVFSFVSSCLFFLSDAIDKDNDNLLVEEDRFVCSLGWR